MQGFVNYSGAIPRILWNLYSGPGLVIFADPSQTNTLATFSQTGAYTLMLSADDGIHSIAYEASVITVTNAISLTIARTGAGAELSWRGGSPPYVLERADQLLFPAALWQPAATTSLQNVSMPISGQVGYFRIRAN